MLPFTLSVPAFLLLALAVPLTLLGEQAVNRIGGLRRLSIPPAVVAGLAAAVGLFAVAQIGWVTPAIESRTAVAFWSWPVTIEPQWAARPTIGVTLPLMVAFFTCIGLNASWELVRPGAWLVISLLAIATALAVVQNVVGLIVAKTLGVSPLLGLACGALTLTGGPGTAAGFAPEFERLGLAGAGPIALAAATFGIVAGGLVGGPVGSWLIRRHRLAAANTREAVPGSTDLGATSAKPAGLRSDFAALAESIRELPLLLLAIVACMKAGAWLTYGLQQVGALFSVQIGAMIAGVVLRNLHDALGACWIRTELVLRLANVFLAVFIAAAMVTLNLGDLAAVGGPMLLLLTIQVLVAILFVIGVTFRLLGRNYDAAVISAGHLGFGLGITANAVANLHALTARHGPSARAYLCVPVVGAFLIDFTNGLVITAFLQRVH